MELRKIEKAIDDLTELEYNTLTNGGETDVFGAPLECEDFDYEADKPIRHAVQYVPADRARLLRRR